MKTMKKKLFLMLAVACTACLSLALLAGCSSDDSSKDEPAASEETKTLVVGFDNSYPPYGYIGDDGEDTGFDIELAREVANRLGWNVETRAIDWDAKDAELNQGTITCIWNGFTQEGREDDYTFSEPYMLNEQVIVTKAGSGIESLEDLADKAVITQVDSAALDVLEGEDMADVVATFKDGQVQQISDYNNAFMQLESGQVDAVACDLSIAAYQMANNPDVYVMLEEPLSSEHYAVGFKKGDDETAQQVTDALREMYADGFVEELVEKYSDQGITIENWVLK